MSQLPFFNYTQIFTVPVKLLIRESHAIFGTIQRDHTDLSKQHVITISRRYRSVLHECIDNLTKDIETDHTEQIKTFRDIETIWSLCEILLLDVNPTGTLILQLKNWLKVHFDDFDSEAEAILANISESTVKHTDLYELSQHFVEIFKTKEPRYRSGQLISNDFAEIIISAFEFDLIHVIARCCSYLDDNWWFVTHFIDLLHCSNQLKVHDIVEADKLRDTFLHDYASTLFYDDQLWSMGVTYLDSCSELGSYFLEVLLSRIPVSLDDETKALRIISLAKKRGLTTLTSGISLLMARRWISKMPRLSDSSLKVDKYKGSKDTDLPKPVILSNALYWAVKSGDTTVTTYISDQCLYYYSITGAFPEMSIFESLKRLPLNNERLAFLAKYYEFKTKIVSKDLSDAELADAGNLIKALIASKIYPRFISSELLRDVHFLLELDPQMVLPAEKTLELMRSIEEITREAKISEDLELRRGLVRNLARALITPISADK